MRSLLSDVQPVANMELPELPSVPDLFRNIAAVVGLLCVLRLLLCEVLTILSGFCAYFLARIGILGKNLKKCGKWAVVTGASEGIGKGYAMELARRGLNIVLISKTKDSMKKVAEEIDEKYGCEVEIISINFTDGKDAYHKIAKELEDIDIGVLVNNVGRSYKYPDFLADVGEKRLRKIVDVNCQAVVQMTKIVLPKMLEKKRGVIVNVSCAASLRPQPLLTVFSATKIFVNYFSDALRKEYSCKGICVQTVTPYAVVSRPTSYACSAVATIGVQKTTFGCFSHALKHYIIAKFPVFLQNRMAWKKLMKERVKQKSMKPKKD